MLIIAEAPAGLVFFSGHSGDVSPKVAPWCRDPWPSVGDPTRCEVCAGTVARSSSVSRGEALSPQTATESMARGVLSAPLSIILPPCLFLSFSPTFSFSLLLPLSHRFLFALYFSCCVSLFYFSLFVFPLTFFFFWPSQIVHFGCQLFSLSCTAQASLLLQFNLRGVTSFFFLSLTL